MSNFIFSNEQKSIFEYDKNDVIQVNGSPGSGKTLVAIKKAILLAEKYNKKVLFLYYNKSLGYEIRRLFGTFDEYSLLKNKIVIDHIDNYIKDEINSTEFPALSENRSEQNINYKLIVNKLMLKGNEYYRILEVNNFRD